MDVNGQHTLVGDVSYGYECARVRKWKEKKYICKNAYSRQTGMVFTQRLLCSGNGLTPLLLLMEGLLIVQHK